MRFVALGLRPGSSSVDEAAADRVMADALTKVLPLREDCSAARFSLEVAMEVPRPLSDSWYRDGRRLVRGRRMRRSCSGSLVMMVWSRIPWGTERLSSRKDLHGDDDEVSL